MTFAARTHAGAQGYAKLRRLIIYGHVPSGARLGEVEWSQKLQVHRSALREAMALLEHEGLLRRGARGGYFVPQFEPQDVREIVEARIVIELGALRIIAVRSQNTPEAAPVDCTSLRFLCDQMERMLESELIMGFVEADRKFHETLVSLAGNSRISRMFNNSPLPHLLPSTPLIDISHATMQASLAEHVRIVDLIESSQFSDAGTLLESHISRLLIVLQTSPESSRNPSRASIDERTPA